MNGPLKKIATNGGLMLGVVALTSSLTIGLGKYCEWNVKTREDIGAAKVRDNNVVLDVPEQFRTTAAFNDRSFIDGLKKKYDAELLKEIAGKETQNLQHQADAMKATVIQPTTVPSPS